MTDLERRDVEYLLSALKRAEWAGPGKTCPVCGRRKDYGATHVCSCVIKLALVKTGTRLMGSESVNAPAPPEFVVEDVARRYADMLPNADAAVPIIMAAIRESLGCVGE